jgi:hypothetical protein
MVPRSDRSTGDIAESGALFVQDPPISLIHIVGTFTVNGLRRRIRCIVPTAD